MDVVNICPKCKINVESYFCPNCGRRMTKKKKKKKSMGCLTTTVAVILIIFGLSNMFKACSNMASDAADGISESYQEEKASYATMEKFNQIQTGMSYDDVVSIMGSEGELSSESEVEGYKTQIYVWYAMNGYSNMLVIIQDGVVSSKSQNGLE